MHTLLGFLCLGVVLATCGQPETIPGVGTEKGCNHQGGCLKRVKTCTALSCEVICEIAPKGIIEKWECVNNAWQRQGAALNCSSTKPCPPFPRVQPSRCKQPVILGYVVNNELTACVEVMACPLDRKLYSQGGELFKEHKACLTRLGVCKQQAINNTASTAPSKNPTVDKLRNATENVKTKHLAAIAATNPTQQPQNSSKKFKNVTESNSTSEEENATEVQVPVGWPLSILTLPDVSASAAQIVVKTLSGPVVKPLQPLIRGPWGSPGLNVDIAMKELQKLNPTFTIVKTHEFTPYSAAVGDSFARLLFDDQNLLVSIMRQ